MARDIEFVERHVVPQIAIESVGFFDENDSAASVPVLDSSLVFEELDHLVETRPH